MTTKSARRIALICGGQSSEHVVSLTSARCVAHALDRYRYEIRPYCLTGDGLWICPEQTWGPGTPPSQIEKLFDLLDNPEIMPTGYFPMRTPAEGISRLAVWQPDIVLPILHGAYGEDGRIQGLLDLLGIPYVGCGVLAGSLCMDKRRTKEFLAGQGIRMARHILMRRATPQAHREEQLMAAGTLLGWPVVVKPCHGGSSIATAIVDNPEDIHRAVNRAFREDYEVLLEERISGTEVTCAVLDLAESHGGRVVCPPTEIRPKRGAFFDYDSKYRPGASEEITPAEIPDEVIARVQAVAEKVHDLLGCRGISRTDMIVNHEGQPIYLETNTMPGMTQTSLVPQGASAIGISMTSMLTGLIEGVFEVILDNKAREER